MEGWKDGKIEKRKDGKIGDMRWFDSPEVGGIAQRKCEK
jgi:hypothetical protein